MSLQCDWNFKGISAHQAEDAPSLSSSLNWIPLQKDILMVWKKKKKKKKEKFAWHFLGTALTTVDWGKLTAG